MPVRVDTGHIFTDFDAAAQAIAEDIRGDNMMAAARHNVDPSFDRRVLFSQVLYLLGDWTESEGCKNFVKECKNVTAPKGTGALAGEHLIGHGQSPE